MIDAMCEIYGSRRENIRVSIGPSIGPCCYEVRNQEQLDSFEKKYKNIRLHEGRKFVDLWDSIAQDMQRAGIIPSHYENMQQCTVCHNNIFASHRKDNPNSTINLTGISIHE